MSRPFGVASAGAIAQFVFTGMPIIPQYLISRLRVPLRHSEDWRSLFFLGLLAVLIFIQWSGLSQNPLLMIPTCVLSFIACVIKHNHVHRSVFTSVPWNHGFNYALALATGQSTVSIIPVHNDRHHRKNQTEEDCVRSTQVNHKWNWMNFLLFPFTAIGKVRKVKKGDFTRMAAAHPELARQWQRERLAVLCMVFLLLAADVRATLVFCVLPWLFGQWGIVTINLLQHQGCDHDSRYNHSRNITGKWVNWLFLNNGFHTAHHMRPGLHWSRLPEWHNRHVAAHIRPELDHPSLALSVWKQFFIQSREGR